MPPRPTARALPAAALLVAAAALTGCTGSDDGSPPTPAVPTSTPLAQLDLSGLTGLRAPFCEVLDAAEGDPVATVLGGAATRTAHHTNGQRATLAPGVVDVAHEDACVYRRGRVEARAWVFVQPVRTGEARRLLRDRRDARGCRPGPELAYGAPGATTVCRDGGRTTAGAAGLFGDAWVTCEVERPTPPADRRAARVEEALRFCVAAAAAVATS